MTTEASSVWPRGAPAVGQKAELFRRVEANYIELFSEISGDYNPVHYDEALCFTAP